MFSNKKNKKGFTLIELSVVLLVLAFLVGGVLISRKVIDRSQAQSIITELETMKKGIALFKDAYDFLPGDIPSVKMDMIPEFSSFCSTNCTYKLPNTTSYGSTTFTIAMNMDTIGSGLISLPSATYGMRQMAIAGFIAGVPNIAQAANNVTTADLPNNIYQWFNKTVMIKNTKKAKVSPAVAVTFGRVYTSNSASVIHSLQSLGHNLGKTAATFAGTELGAAVGTYTNKVAVAMHNVNDLGLAAFTANVSYIVDNKIDDGLPATGMLIGDAFPDNNSVALSGGYTFGTKDSNITYCHKNKAGDYLSTANKYENTTSLVRGCNLFYFFNIS